MAVQVDQIDPKIKDRLNFHPVNPSGQLAINEIRDLATQLSQLIHNHVRHCPERDTAQRHVKAAVMWANSAIACNGRY